MPAAVLEKLATIQMVEVWIPMVDGRWLVLPRHTQPEKDVQAMLDQLKLGLRSQPRRCSPCCGEDLLGAFTEFQ